MKTLSVHANTQEYCELLLQCNANEAPSRTNGDMNNENGHTFIRNEDLHSAIKEQSQAMFHYNLTKMGDLHILF